MANGKRMAKAAKTLTNTDMVVLPCICEMYVHNVLSDKGDKILNILY